MKLIILGLIVAGAILFLFGQDFMKKQVDCPRCLGTGRILPTEQICGSQNERLFLPPLSKKYTLCRSSHKCSACEGKGLMPEDKAKNTSAGLYVLTDVAGIDSAVFE